MPILQIETIHRFIQDGQLRIFPFEHKYKRPSSVLLRLSNQILCFNQPNKIIDPFSENIVQEKKEFTDFLLPPRTLILGSTIEQLSLPSSIAGILCNMSHLARLGLDIHGGSFLVSPGFGQEKASSLTLEIYNRNQNHIKLHAGMPICHILFIETDQYNFLENTQSVPISLYTGQQEPLSSKYYKEFQLPTYYENLSD